MPYPAAIHSTPGDTVSTSTRRGSLLARVVTPITTCIHEVGAGRDGGGRPPGTLAVQVRRIAADRPPVPPD